MNGKFRYWFLACLPLYDIVYILYVICIFVVKLHVSKWFRINDEEEKCILR